MDISYYFIRLWNVLISHGIPLASLLILAMLIPRIGRLAVRLISNRFDDNDEATKARLALVGALVYILEAIAYFALILLALTNLGISTMGAAVPATVVSAAVGFGSQKIIGDFLSGFFIISEKQFGVGDYVSFQGGGTPVEGTVVGLTLRATKIRTTAGELVTVPNGSATIVTNYSQEWARAVVTLPIPMDPDGSMGDLITDVEAAARSAISSPEVSADVTDELEILPATNINQPTAAGLPWSVDFRVIVQVNPARQWAVERAIRTSLLDSFWHRYESIMSGAGDYNPLSEELSSFSTLSPFSSSPSQELPTQQGKHARMGTNTEAEDTSPNENQDKPLKDTEKLAAFVAQGPQPEDPPTEILDSPTPTSAATISATTETNSSSSDNLSLSPSLPENPSNPSSLDLDSTDSLQKPTAEQTPSAEENYYYDSRIKHWLSLGGRIRPSTTTLLLILLVLLFLNVLSANPDGGKAGILSPARYVDTSTEASIPPSLVDPALTTEPAVVDDLPLTTTESSPTLSSPITSESTESEQSESTEESLSSSLSSAQTHGAASSTKAAESVQPTGETATSASTTEAQASAQTSAQNSPLNSAENNSPKSDSVENNSRPVADTGGSTSFNSSHSLDSRNSTAPNNIAPSTHAPATEEIPSGS